MSLFFAGKTNKAVFALSYFLSTKHSPRVGHPSAGSRQRRAWATHCSSPRQAVLKGS